MMQSNIYRKVIRKKNSMGVPQKDTPAIFFTMLLCYLICAFVARCYHIL